MISLKNLCLNVLEKENDLEDLGLVFPERDYHRRPTLFFIATINYKGLCCPEDIYDDTDEDSHSVYKTIRVFYTGYNFNVVFRKFIMCRCMFDFQYTTEYSDGGEVYDEISKFIRGCDTIRIYEEDPLEIIPTKKLDRPKDGLFVDFSNAKEYIEELPLNILSEKKPPCQGR